MTCLFMGFTNTRHRLATQVQFHGLGSRALDTTILSSRVCKISEDPSPYPSPHPMGRGWPSGRVRGVRASHQLGCGVELRPVHADGFVADENAVCKSDLTVLLKPAASGNANCQTSIQRPKRQNEPETLPVCRSSFPVRLPQRAVGDTFVH